jgi:predicted phage terminase large subunit-like protein
MIARHFWRVEWAHTDLVIEDRGSGSSLIQFLKIERIYTQQQPREARGRQGHEAHRAGCQFHAGLVHFREDAPWLNELLAELLGFHGVRHDDQGDSISQALAFINGGKLIGAASSPCRSAKKAVLAIISV